MPCHRCGNRYGQSERLPYFPYFRQYQNYYNYPPEYYTPYPVTEVCPPPPCPKPDSPEDPKPEDKPEDPKPEDPKPNSEEKPECAPDQFWDESLKACNWCPVGYTIGTDGTCMPSSKPNPIVEDPVVEDDPIVEDPVVEDDPIVEDPVVEDPIVEDPPPTEDERTPDFSPHGLQTERSMINEMTKISQATGPKSVVSQDPDGIKWIAKDKWAPWDGTPISITGKSKEQLCKDLFPNGPDTMKGLRERFYEVNPFADNQNPTPGEIENWNIEVIKHFRKLIGSTTPIKNDARLYLEARWADERKHTAVWNQKYPGPINGNPAGPCNPTDYTLARSHCGGEFFPSATERAEYISEAPYNDDFITYPELMNYTDRHAATEGMATLNANIPWSVRLSRVLGTYVCTEGLWFHAGPFTGLVGPDSPDPPRTEFGVSWWITQENKTATSASVGYRGKWH